MQLSGQTVLYQVSRATCDAAGGSSSPNKDSFGREVSVTCYIPEKAAPAPSQNTNTNTVITQVNPVIQTQVSPNISPTMVQQQKTVSVASPANIVSTAPTDGKSTGVNYSPEYEFNTWASLPAQLAEASRMRNQFGASETQIRAYLKCVYDGGGAVTCENANIPKPVAPTPAPKPTPKPAAPAQETVYTPPPVTTVNPPAPVVVEGPTQAAYNPPPVSNTTVPVSSSTNSAAPVESTETSESAPAKNYTPIILGGLALLLLLR